MKRPIPEALAQWLAVCKAVRDNSRDHIINGTLPEDWDNTWMLDEIRRAATSKWGGTTLTFHLTDPQKQFLVKAWMSAQRKAGKETKAATP